MTSRHACGETLTELGDRIALCERCHVLAAPHGHGDVVSLRGVAVRLRRARAERAPSTSPYRDVPLGARDDLEVSRLWRTRFGLAGVVLGIWGAGVAAWAAGLAWMSVHDGRLAMIFVSIAVGALGASALYVALCNLVERTVVRIGAHEITRSHEPFRWRATEARPRVGGECVKVRDVRENDVRNGGARWPAPITHQVIVEHGSSPLVLFDQMTEQDAKAAATIVATLLDTRRARTSR